MKGITVGGFVITGIYAAGVACYVVVNSSSFAGLAPNELGDFIAGFFGPLAFFWLICGYLQQGIELNQNTRALELQVQELQNSVDQQRELVAVTREQMQLEVEETRHQRELARLATLPRIVGSYGGSFNGRGDAHLRLTMTNIAAEIRSVMFSMPQAEKFKIPTIHLWSRGQSYEIAWSLDATEELNPLEIVLTYLDINAAPGQMAIFVRFTEKPGASQVRFDVHVEVVNPK